jgi:4-hydroxy-tetrahydrodipicolinate reductase
MRYPTHHPTLDGDEKPRIIIVGTGQYGLTVARIALKKGWPIAGAVNRAGGKVGKDLGELLGLDDELGIVVQDCETADYAKMHADVAVVVTTDFLEMNLANYRRILNAGINVVCHGTESYYPYGIDTQLASDIDALAKANGVTFTGTGIWDMSRIWSGILAVAPCTELNSLFHRSVTDADRLGEALSRMLGVGLTVEEFEQQMANIFGDRKGLYLTVPHQVLVALGYTVVETTERREPVCFDEPIHSRSQQRTIDAGLCAGFRMAVEAVTEEGVTARADIEIRVLHEGETEHMLWSVDGMPSSKVTVERDDSVHASASSLFNRILDVIAAPPGIQEIYKLGIMKHSALL